MKVHPNEIEGLMTVASAIEDKLDSEYVAATGTLTLRHRNADNPLEVKVKFSQGAEDNWQEVHVTEVK